MIRILKAGIWSRFALDREMLRQGFAGETSKEGIEGMTLLELLVVMVLLGSAMLIILPRIPLLESFSLNSDARRIAGFFRYLDESSSSKKIYYRVWFYPEEESIEVESSVDGFEFKGIKDASLKGFRLADGDIQDIVVQGLGKIDHGDVAVVFNPGIGAEPFNLHIKKDGLILTISYNSYSGKVKILEGYV